MRAQRDRKKKLIVAFHFQFANRAGWDCDACRKNGLETRRRCGFLPSEARGEPRLVWIRKRAQTDECPRSMVTGESQSLLEEFFVQHVDETLAPKTVERYHEQAAYLDPGLLAMALADITPLCQGRSQSFPPRRRKRGPLSVFHSRLFLGVWGRLKRSPATRLRGAFRAERKPPPNAAHNIRDR